MKFGNKCSQTTLRNVKPYKKSEYVLTFSSISKLL